MQSSCIKKTTKVNKRIITYKNVKYGMLVEVIDPLGGGGVHAGCKVHFFNKKGVLIGSYYKFVSYDKLRIRENTNGVDRQFQRFFYETPFETLKACVFKAVLLITGKLIRFTQKHMD